MRGAPRRRLHPPHPPHPEGVSVPLEKRGAPPMINRSRGYIVGRGPLAGGGLQGWAGGALIAAGG
eukprot:8366922-Pyramimonas_sp.AAC.1